MGWGSMGKILTCKTEDQGWFCRPHIKLDMVVCIPGFLQVDRKWRQKCWKLANQQAWHMNQWVRDSVSNDVKGEDWYSMLPSDLPVHTLVHVAHSPNHKPEFIHAHIEWEGKREREKERERKIYIHKERLNSNKPVGLILKILNMPIVPSLLWNHNNNKGTFNVDVFMYWLKRPQIWNALFRK